MRMLASVVAAGLLLAEAASGHAMGEAAMIYLLPFKAFPALLIAVGLVRLLRKPPAARA